MVLSSKKATMPNAEGREMMQMMANGHPPKFMAFQLEDNTKSKEKIGVQKMLVICHSKNWLR